jgi:16S rRNA (cytosine1402-N4)-methyltransferase
VSHVPVLLKEVMRELKPRRKQIAVDCTVGLGGHAAELLRRGLRVIGLDLDPANLKLAGERLGEVGGEFSLHHANFAGLPGVLGEVGVEAVDVLVADLGVASPHLDDPARGFSYRRDGPLDMRMDPGRGRPAWQVLEGMSEPELAALLREWGDEEEAERIAAAIRERKPRRTRELADLVCEAKGFSPDRGAGAKQHPAARTFQAIRMAVNREPANLERLLAVLPSVLKPGGRAAIVSFHSGEDRRVKQSFREGLRAGVYSAVSDDPILPTEEEARSNPRARSAKLRVCRRARV